MGKITDSDTYAPALAPFIPVAEGIAALFMPYAEVVVHDLSTGAVAHIANPISRRTPGDPSQLDDIGFTAGQSVIGPYEKTNWDGRRMKCTSSVLYEDGTPIGLLCINLDVTQFEQVRRALEGFLVTKAPGEDVQALFRHDWHERTNDFITTWCAAKNIQIGFIDRSMRRELIGALKDAGLLEQRRAPAYIARILGISRATVYNELAALKQPGA